MTSYEKGLGRWLEGFDEVEVEAHSEVRNRKCSEQEQE